MNIKQGYLLKLFIFLSGIPQIGISQPKSQIGFGLGISVSQFRTENVSYEAWGARTTTKTNPIFSPVAGISNEWLFRNHYKITTGLEYQMSGYKSYSIMDLIPFTDDYNQEWKILKIHKFCLPLTLGYQFKLFKINPALYLGVRPNLILSGKVNINNQSYISSQNRIENIEYGYNLFRDGYMVVPPKRIFTQFCIGISSSIRQRFTIDFNYCIGNSYYKLIHIRTGTRGNTIWYEKKSLPGSDYILKIRYHLFNSRKQKGSEIIRN